MPDLLTAAQLETLRKEFIWDYVDLHPEWGTAPTVEHVASVGAVSLDLTSLGSGTINRGTGFYHLAAGVRRDRYTVTASVAIAAGKATVSISPVLVAAASISDRVEVEPILKSVFNKRTRRQLFDDVRLQELAQRATENYGERINGSPDPDRTLYKAVRLYALDQMLAPGSEFLAAILADDVRGNARFLVEELRNTLARDEAELNTKARGHHSVFLEK